MHREESRNTVTGGGGAPGRGVMARWPPAAAEPAHYQNQHSTPPTHLRGLLVHLHIEKVIQNAVLYWYNCSECINTRIIHPCVLDGINVHLCQKMEKSMQKLLITFHNLFHHPIFEFPPQVTG